MVQLVFELVSLSIFHFPHISRGFFSISVFGPSTDRGSRLVGIPARISAVEEPDVEDSDASEDGSAGSAGTRLSLRPFPPGQPWEPQSNRGSPEPQPPLLRVSVLARLLPSVPRIHHFPRVGPPTILLYVRGAQTDGEAWLHADYNVRCMWHHDQCGVFSLRSLLDLRGVGRCRLVG